MPTYEYRCQQCDRTFDVVQSFSDDPLDACPTCGGPVKKVFGSVGIVFKGSGFYKTDSRASGAASTKPTSPASDAGTTPSPSSGTSEPAASSTPASSTPAPVPATTPATSTSAASSS